MNRWTALGAILVGGCAPQLVATRASTAGDNVTIAFCGAEALTETTSSNGVAFGRGLTFTASTEQADMGMTDVCLRVKNDSDGKVLIDRRAIRLIGDGFRAKSLRDGQERFWPLKPGADEELTVTFVTDSLDKGDEIALSLKGAVTLDGSAVKLAPLHLAYK